MKSAALIFLLIFTFALATPTVASFCNEEISVLFNADEENNNSQKSNSENEKKDVNKLFFTAKFNNDICKVQTEVNSATVFTLHSPFLGIVTPPPDIC